MSNRKENYHSEVERSCSKIYGHYRIASHSMNEDEPIDVLLKTPTRKVSNFEF